MATCGDLSAGDAEQLPVPVSLAAEDADVQRESSVAEQTALSILELAMAAEPESSDTEVRS